MAEKKVPVVIYQGDERIEVGHALVSVQEDHIIIVAHVEEETARIFYGDLKQVSMGSIERIHNARD